MLTTCVLAVACTSRAPRSQNVIYRNAQPAADAGSLQPAADVSREAGESEKLLDEMSRKMDEYQDLLATCERIGNAEEDEEYRAACKALLANLRSEILNLSERFPHRE